MRITSQMTYNNFNAGLQVNMEAIYNDNAQIASGKKLNRPSDDPAAMSSIILGKAQLLAFEGFQNSIADSTMLLNTTETSLNSLSSVIESARQAASNAYDALSTDLPQYSTMTGDLIQSAIGLGNTQLSNKYIFAGYNTDTAAINPTTGMYQGSSNRIPMTINSGVQIDVNFAGNELIAYGPVPATNENSGLITATGSLSDPAGVYTVNGGSLSISLGGGPVTTVTINAGATLGEVRDAINAADTGVRAEVVDANVNGTPADYRIVFSATPSSPASDISVTATTTDGAGAGLNLLASASMTSVVSPDSTVIGSMSILKAAIEMEDKPAIQRAQTYLSDVAATIRVQQSDVGMRLNRIELEKKYLATRDLDVTTIVSEQLNLSDVEMARVIVDSQQRQASLQSLRSISSGFLQTSLFDFLK